MKRSERLKRKAQAISEYAIVVLLVIAAVAAMQVYVKRRHQGMSKLAADLAGGALLDNTGVFNATGVQQVNYAEQYEPYYLASNVNVNRSGGSVTNIGQGYTTNMTSRETVVRTGKQQTLGSNALNQDAGWITKRKP